MITCLVYTAASTSVIDKEVAEACQLNVTRSQGSNFGTYSAPGCPSIPYYGVIWGPVDIRMGPDVVVQLPYLRVIDHPHPLTLLGADVLRAGRPLPSWSFGGITNVETDKGVESYMHFQKEAQRAT